MIFNLDLQAIEIKKNYSYNLNPQKEISGNEINIFEMVAPIMYQLKRVKFDLQMPFSKENMEFKEKAKYTKEDVTLNKYFTEVEQLHNIYNQWIISNLITDSCHTKLDKEFKNEVRKDRFSRNYAKINKK